MNRNCAILGATKSLQNAHALLDDSKLLSKGKRHGTSYALAIFALEETAKAFVFHWVADGNLTEADLRKLIYSHRPKHAIIQLTDFFEKATSIFLPVFKTGSFTLDEDDGVRMLMTTRRQASRDVHLLIHAQQRREVSLYVDICSRCNRELLGPWLITASDVDELRGYVQQHLVKMESFIRNCKRHQSGNVLDSKAPFSSLVKHKVESLEKAAKTECRHVLCSNVPWRQRKREE